MFTRLALRPFNLRLCRRLAAPLMLRRRFRLRVCRKKKMFKNDQTARPCRLLVLRRLRLRRRWWLVSRPFVRMRAVMTIRRQFRLFCLFRGARSRRLLMVRTWHRARLRLLKITLLCTCGV